MTADSSIVNNFEPTDADIEHMDELSRHWGRYYGTLYRETSRFMREVYADFDLSYSEVITLVYVYENPGAIQDEITRELGFDKSATARTLKNLEAQGYVTRKVDESNQRVKRVFSNEKAHDVQETMNLAMYAWNEKLLAPIAPDQRLAFLRMLHTIMYRALDIDHTELISQVNEKRAHS